MEGSADAWLKAGAQTVIGKSTNKQCFYSCLFGGNHAATVMAGRDLGVYWPHILY